MTGHQIVYDETEKPEGVASAWAKGACRTRTPDPGGPVAADTKTSAGSAALATNSGRTIGKRPRPVNHGGPLLPRLRNLVAAALAGLAGVAGGLPALAAETPQAAPLWVPVPTRIDRDNQARERVVEPARAPDDRLYLRVAPAGPHFDALTFLSDDGRVVRLAGVTGYERTRICTLPDGGRWACGLRASMALKSWVAGRLVTCRERPDAGPVEVRPPGSRASVRAVPADCSLDGRSLAERLVAEGWAAPIDPSDPALAPAAKAARTARLGVWSDRAAE